MLCQVTVCELRRGANEKPDFAGREAILLLAGGASPSDELALRTSVQELGLGRNVRVLRDIEELNRILERPANEKPFLLLVVGHPAADAQVPVITKKPLDAISTFR